MPIMLYGHCWRGRSDCEAIHCIDAAPEGTTERQLMEGDYYPDSFVCSGVIASDKRDPEQDCYRLCFVSEQVDDMSDNDVQDLSHVASVVTAALALDSTRAVNSGFVKVPAKQGETKEHGQ